MPAEFIDDVFDFCRAAERRGGDGNLLPNPKYIRQACKHLFEEWSELQEAIGYWERNGPWAESPVHMANTADAFLDAIYVCFNGLYAMGLDEEQVLGLWSAIHNANMAKFGPDGARLDPDGKVLKPAGWRPAELEPILQEYLYDRKATD